MSSGKLTREMQAFGDLLRKTTKILIQVLLERGGPGYGIDHHCWPLLIAGHLCSAWPNIAQPCPPLLTTIFLSQKYCIICYELSLVLVRLNVY